ncbi:MAG TPA: DNA methylase, partial [Planktothrix sp. UBA8407]|nr:DNA methylase [Planktothrix sp. UBA8407]
MSQPPRPAVFIEKIMPVKLLNEQVYFEHGGNPFKGLHRWYSRKPLSFSRASVLASILPADIDIKEFEKLLGLNPGVETRLYKTPPTSAIIKKVQDYCEQTWGTRTPTILDAFAGGGSIPFEAARYGLNVLASDLNPVAVVTMKAAMEYPLKFGPDLQEDIDKWVKWVGDEAEKRLAEFFPSLPGETVQNYLWAHTVICPTCQSVVPLSPNWWVDRSPGAIKKGQICAVKPIPNLEQKRVDFELIQGKKGKGTTIITNTGEEYDPDSATTMGRGVGKCPNCENLLENEFIYEQSRKTGMGHQVYAVAYRKGQGNLEFRISQDIDFSVNDKIKDYLDKNWYRWQELGILPDVEIPYGHQFAERSSFLRQGIDRWDKVFNPRQLLTIVTYVEIINEAKALMQVEYEWEKVEAVSTYLALVLDRCADRSCRLARWDSSRTNAQGCSAQHALNLMWNYPESSGKYRLWEWCAETAASDYSELCSLFGTKPHLIGLPGIEQYDPKTIQINSASADSLYHIPDNSVDAIITDPPYYATIQYAELSDFFYVWQKRTLGDIFPELFFNELTDKDREAVANPSRFRNMGENPEKLANQDYEAKMALAFGEYYRVLRPDGVMTVQFNHKESGAWDVLAKSLIDAGFEITASWAVSTENPQNLHQAQKNSVSSTVLLVCRKRDPNASQAWWDDLRTELTEALIGKTIKRSDGKYYPLPTQKKSQKDEEYISKLEWLEENGIEGINLYLSAFGPALNVFSRYPTILDSSGEEVRPEKAFQETRKAIANYRFRKLVETDTSGFDPLTQWYLLAWDAFGAREFPFDEARQLALAVGGFNVSDLVKTSKLIDSASGTCKLLTPQQRLKKRAFSVNPSEFSLTYLVDGLHAIIAIYEEEGVTPVRRFMEVTGLVSNDLFMRTIEVALKVIPCIKDEKKCLIEQKVLLDLWLAMDEIKGKVKIYDQLEL